MATRAWGCSGSAGWAGVGWGAGGGGGAGEQGVGEGGPEGARVEAGVGRGAVGPRPEEAALAWEAVRRQEARDAVLPWAALQEGEEALPSEPLSAARPRAGVRPSAAHPWALLSTVAWAFRRDRALPSAWPVPPPMARFARVMACFRVAPQ